MSKQYIASLSYGKDSIYMLEVIHQNKLPLDRIAHVEVWATDTINADLPPMVEFKKKAKKVIEDRYGVEVEHVKAEWNYKERFYKRKGKGSKNQGSIYGWPINSHPWCSWDLKRSPLSTINTQKVIEYIGFAIDEPNLKRQETINDYLGKSDSKKRYPLVDYKVTEQEAMEWCRENNLLSPIYDGKVTRGGCWFCHNQRIDELRNLRKIYPEYWKLMLKWDKDSPTKWQLNRTLHDYEKRFVLEDLGQVPTDRTFRWKMIG